MKAKSTLLVGHGILTREQLREALGLSDETLTKMERDDGFPMRKAGRIKLYDVALIKEWIANPHSGASDVTA